MSPFGFGKQDDERAVIAVDDLDFDKTVLESDIPVLVEFWADWCAPCKTIAPYLDDLAAIHAGKVRIAKLDADDNAYTINAYKVRGIPTFLLFRDGEEIGRVSSASPPDVDRLLAKVLGD